MLSLLESAVKAERLILSSAGSPAREEWQDIIERKRTDVLRANHSVWVVNSNAARPGKVQSFCRDQGARYVIFVTRKALIKPNGQQGRLAVRGVGTSRNQRARSYSEDEDQYRCSDLHPLLSPVTGDIKRTTTG